MPISTFETVRFKVGSVDWQFAPSQAVGREPNPGRSLTKALADRSHLGFATRTPQQHLSRAITSRFPHSTVTNIRNGLSRAVEMPAISLKSKKSQISRPFLLTQDQINISDSTKLFHPLADVHQGLLKHQGYDQPTSVHGVKHCATLKTDCTALASTNEQIVRVQSNTTQSEVVAKHQDESEQSYDSTQEQDERSQTSHSQGSTMTYGYTDDESDEIKTPDQTSFQDHILPPSRLSELQYKHDDIGNVSSPAAHIPPRTTSRGMVLSSPSSGRVCDSPRRASGIPKRVPTTPTSASFGHRSPSTVPSVSNAASPGTPPTLGSTISPLGSHPLRPARSHLPLRSPLKGHEKSYPPEELILKDASKNNVMKRPSRLTHDGPVKAVVHSVMKKLDKSARRVPDAQFIMMPAADGSKRLEARKVTPSHEQERQVRTSKGLRGKIKQVLDVGSSLDLCQALVKMVGLERSTALKATYLALAGALNDSRLMMKELEKAKVMAEAAAMEVNAQAEIAAVTALSLQRRAKTLIEGLDAERED